MPRLPLLGIPMGGLGDYLQPLPYRTKDSEGHAGQGGAYGPVEAPITSPPYPEGATELLLRIAQLLERMPAAVAMEYCRKFMWPTREALWFVATIAEQSLAAGASGIVATQAIDERQNGSLEFLALNVNPAGSANSIAWDILINGQPHPRFSQRVFNSGNLATPFKFKFELIQNRTISLQATNTAAAAISVSGLMIGWTEFLTDVKPYGDASAAGIS